jgi:diadenosine tetraphosphate (Ap4A) HIT family hydrolase
VSTCPLCDAIGEDILWQDDFCRVVLVGDPNYPGFCRVILNHHIKEMTDLPPLERQRMMITVLKVETALREVLNPDKINLASLGNMVPHLHWHVIPRFTDDRHFPDPIWAAARQAGAPHGLSDLKLQLERTLAAALGPVLDPRQV